MGELSCVQMARKFDGIKEVQGQVDNPQIMAFLRLDQSWPSHDEVPWCSAFANYVAWLADRQRTVSMQLRARAWLRVGVPLDLDNPLLAASRDVRLNTAVIFMRGGSTAGPDVLDAPGHVAFYLDHTESEVRVIGGNQSDSVSIASYPRPRVLGLRYLPTALP